MTYIKTLLFFTFVFTHIVASGENVSGGGAPGSKAGGPRHNATAVNMCDANLMMDAAKPESKTTKSAIGYGVARARKGSPQSSAMAGAEESSCVMQLDPDFAKALKETIPKCAREAGEASGYCKGLTGPVGLQHMGGFNQRKVNKGGKAQKTWSRHSIGRALDASALSMSCQDGRKDLKLTKDGLKQSASFYNKFRECWNNAQSQDGRKCLSSIGCDGSEHKPQNSDHNDHMHISIGCDPPGIGVNGNPRISAI